MSNRFNKLLFDVARQFENGQQPMHEEWLRENNVTIDECNSLMSVISTILMGYAKAPLKVQTMLVVCSVADDEKMAKHLVAVVERDGVLHKLKEL